jgi:tripartite-type tricarboxylate transporter receptor subunit TctC
MDKKKYFYFLVTFFLFFTFLSNTLAAEKYPSRELQMIIPVPPGGALSIVIQFMKENFEKNLGVPIILNYQAGGGGAIGPNMLAKSKPDGYTIGCLDSAKYLLLPATIPNIPFKYSDFDPLCKFFLSPQILFCKGDAPWKTLEDLVADAKKRPGQINYGATTNSISQFIMMGFLESAGIKMLHVPTKAAGETITRILGGNLDIGIVALTPLVGQLKAGELRGLFITTQRMSAFPQIPNLKEMGYPIVINLSYGFFAPLGMPQPVRETLTKALEKTLQDPSLKKKLEEVESVLEYLPPEAFAKEVKEDYERLTKFLKTAGPQK